MSRTGGTRRQRFLGRGPISLRNRASMLLTAASILGAPVAVAQVFVPLLADPQEPQFFGSYLFARAPSLSSRLGTVGFGQTIGLVRGRDWQLSLAAAALSQFDMESETTDLINTDYLVGVPFTYRHDTWGARFRIYHQSSHLGDGYIVHGLAQPFKLGFEAAELLVADDLAHWRIYGGGEYLFHHIPARLRPGVLHGGLEYRGATALVHLGRFGSGRLVAGLDGKSCQEDGWQVGWSLVTGLELEDPGAASGASWRWSLLLKAYTGPSPYGEFYRDQLSSVGVGVGFAL